MENVTNDVVETPGQYGNTQNEKKREYERAIVDKKVSHSNKSGEYFIDLTIEGKDNTQIEKQILYLFMIISIV